MLATQTEAIVILDSSALACKSRQSSSALTPPDQSVPFRQKWEKAKLLADGGLILFSFEAGYLAAFYDDAETISDVLGVLPSKRAGDLEAPPQILLSLTRLERNLRYMRAHGYENIWIERSGVLAPADDMGEINNFRMAAIYSDHALGLPV